uniref:CBS domain-containing protein n=1 Tax=Arcella intermedia TaxID=1963864 RepID=A0A6B2L9W5_9EUKA
MEEVKCEEIMPQSSKIVVFDADLKICAAFEALFENNIEVAPIWDSSYKGYITMLTFTDLIDLMCSTTKLHSQTLNNPENLETIYSQLNHSSIRHTVVEVKKRISINLNSVEPTDSLYEAASIILKNNTHALPVIFSEDDLTCLYILTPKRLLTFLVKVLPELSSTMEQNLVVDSSRVSPYLFSSVAYPDSTLLNVLEIFARGAPVVPVVSRGQKNLLHLISRFDLMNRFYKDTIPTFMDFSAFVFKNHSTPIQDLVKLPTDLVKDSTLFSYQNTKISKVIKQLLDHSLQIQVILDENNAVLCVVDSLSLLVYFVQK